MDARLYGIYIDACGDCIDDYEHYRKRAKEARKKLKSAQKDFIRDHLNADPGNVYEWSLPSGQRGKSYLEAIIIEDDLITMKWRKLRKGTNLPTNMTDKDTPVYYHKEIKFKLCID